MNYRRVYAKIIFNAKKRDLKKEHGFEIHHILPKSLFPLWEKDKRNLVKLTLREHYFCHQLLVKIFPSSEMSFALISMSFSQKYGKVLSSKQYSYLKTHLSEVYLRRAESMRKVWADENYKYKMKLAIEKSKSSRSEKMKEHWRDDNYRNDVVSKIKESSPIRVEKYKAWAAEHHNELSEKRKQSLENNNIHPEAFLEKFKKENPNFYKDLWNQPEMKQKRSELLTKYYSNEENRKKQSEAIKTSKKHKEATKLANGVKVKCIQTGEIFFSLVDAAAWCGLSNASRISGVCMHKIKSAGKHPITKEKLTWEYVGDENA